MTPTSENTNRILRQLLLVGIISGAALPVSLFAVLVGRGSVEHFVFTVVPALMGVPLLALWGIVIWLFALRNEDPEIKRRMQWIAAVLVGIGHFFLFLAPSYPSGLLLNHRDIRGARFYCESMMPRLESYREANGVYPTVVDSLMPPDRPVPRLLQGKQFYRRVGADYEFSFLDPSPIWGGHTYFSSIVRSRGKWERWN
jgi:hypothetical protein